MLYRVQMREEAARALRAADTSAGPNVWTARSLPLPPQALPAIQLQVLADHAEQWTPGSPNFTRTARLLITARVQFKTDPQGASSEGENQLDAICEQIELALFTQSALPQMVQRIGPIETEIAFDSGGTAQIAVARIGIDLEYLDQFTPPSTPLLDIRGTETSLLTGQPFATFDAALPQS